MTNHDFTKPFTREQLDLKTYNKKFEECDKFLNNKSYDAKLHNKLLNDVTTFSYLILKLEGKPVKLYTYQDAILNDKHKFKIFRAARQIGKSLSLDIKSAYNLVKDHGFGHNECIISASLSQATYQMRRVKQLLNSIDKISWKERVSTDNQSVLVIDILDDKGNVKYQNMLVITPCTEGSLGYSFHQVNLDEIEYWKDVDVEHFMNNIIGPTILATDGSITTFSNPNGSETYIAQLENLKLKDGSNKFHVYVFNFFDCPTNNQEKYDLVTAGLTRQQIEAQYLAIRTLSDKYYFTVEDVESSFDANLDREKNWIADGKETYWFLDVGAKIDQSVLCGAFIEPDKVNDQWIHVNIFCIQEYPVGYPLTRVVGSYDESHDSDGWHYVKSVKEYLEDYSLVKDVYPVFGCDVTGNSGIVPLFKSIKINPIDITFSGPKKWAMYQRLKYYFEKRLLHRIKNKNFDYQMKRMVVTRSKAGRNMIHHEKEDDHDDIPDAIVGLVHLCDNPYTVTPGVTIL